MNNVYMLQTHFAHDSIGNEDAVRQHVENALRKTLGTLNMAEQFSRVSRPCADDGMQMAVVCTEEAAAALRAHAADLEIVSLIKHEGRTSRLRAISTPAALRA